MAGPPPLPSPSGEGPKPTVKEEWDEEAFDRITRHNRLRWIGIALTTPLIVAVSYFAAFLLSCIGGFVVFLACCAGVHQFWTRVFSGSKLHGSVKYDRFKQQLAVQKFRESRDRSN